MAVSRKGRRRIVVDGAEYYWSASDDYEYTGRRVAIVTATGLVRGQHGRWIRFSVPREPALNEPGWWHDTQISITPKMIERAIRIAHRSHDPAADAVLTNAQILETLGLEQLPIDDELRVLERALGPVQGVRGYAQMTAEHELGCALLSIGCRAVASAHETVDDWVVCHSNELQARRAELQRMLDHGVTEQPRDAYQVRSAIEFLLAMSARVGLRSRPHPSTTSCVAGASPRSRGESPTATGGGRIANARARAWSSPLPVACFLFSRV